MPGQNPPLQASRTGSPIFGA